MEQNSAIDLGLSVLWCSCNVGASAQEEPGRFFTWDETFQIQGKNWYIPSIRDFEELITNCKWEWTKEYGRGGYKVIGKNGNQIFLPACGQCCNGISDTGDFYGYYWSSDVNDNLTAWGLSFIPWNFDPANAIHDFNRINGKSIRMVCPK